MSKIAARVVVDPDGGHQVGDVPSDHQKKREEERRRKKKKKKKKKKDLRN